MRSQFHDYDEEPEMYPASIYGDAPFREPGGESALRAGKRKHPCPTCGRKNMLTDADVRHHYQCDICANELERGY